MKTSNSRYENYFLHQRQTSILGTRSLNWTVTLLNCSTNTKYGSRDSSASKETRLRAERPGFNSRQGLRIRLFATASRTAPGPTQSTIQWVPEVLSPWVKRSRREAAKVKNAWSYTSTPQYVFMAWCLVKHRDNFTFTSLENTSSRDSSVV
jgi:hypothetical protein